MHYQTLTNHSLYFSKPNLIHFFLNLYQNHHHSTLNTTNLTSVQENQGIRHEKHQNPTFPPMELTCYLVFLGFSFFIPLGYQLKSLKEKEKSHLTLLHLGQHVFFLLFSFLSFLSLLLSPLMGMAELSYFEQI